jgi:hypothetical protein
MVESQAENRRRSTADREEERKEGEHIDGAGSVPKDFRSTHPSRKTSHWVCRALSRGNVAANSRDDGVDPLRLCREENSLVQLV